MTFYKQIVIILTLLSLTGCATYKFGLRESNYPEYFNNNKEGLNRVWKYNDEFSWLTELPTNRQNIIVEHSVIASDDDIKRLNLPEGDYLFFSIEVIDTNINKIEVQHKYNDKSLETIGVYIVRYYLNINGEVDRTQSGWNIQKYTGELLYEKHKYGFVKIYRIPEEIKISQYIPKAYWFKKPLYEEITLTEIRENDDNVYKFKLKTEWHKSSTIWWRIITIT